jgi:hypothetical protein
VTTVTRGLRAFGRFWLDFLVGDTPELFVATLVVVGAALALASLHVLSIVVVPAVAVVAVVWSAARGRVRTRR